MAEIIWSPRSITDINEIAEFIAKDSFQYAESQTNQFFSKIKALEKHPFSGRIVPELGINNVRQILCGHYGITYEMINNHTITISTVHHQSRLLKNNPSVKRRFRKK